MKTALRALSLLTATVICLTLSSCDDRPEPPYYYPVLQGNYQCAYSDGSLDIYQFNSDGTGYYTTYGAPWVDYFDDFMVSGGYLYILWSDAPDWELEGEIEVNPDSFTIWYNRYDYGYFVCVNPNDSYPLYPYSATATRHSRERQAHRQPL